MPRMQIANNFMNVFSGVTFPHALSYHYILHYFLTMPVGLNLIFDLLNLIYTFEGKTCMTSGFKPHFSVITGTMMGTSQI